MKRRLQNRRHDDLLLHYARGTRSHRAACCQRFVQTFFGAGARRWQKIRTCLRGTIRRWRCLSSHRRGLTLIPTRRPYWQNSANSCIQVGRRKSDLLRSEEWGMDRSVAQATAISQAIREDVAEVAV